MNYRVYLSRIEQCIFFLFLLFLPTQLGKHFWPSFAIVQGLRVDYLAPTMYVTDVLLLILFFIWLLRIFFFRSRKHESGIKRGCQLLNSRRKTLTHTFLFLIPAFYLLLTIFLSGSHGNSWYYFFKFLEVSFLAYYIATTVKTAKQLQMLVLAFSLATIFESCLAIGQYVHQSSLNGIFYFVGERTFTQDTPGIANAVINGHLLLRPYGTFSHPNVLAGYLVCSLILGSFFLNQKSRLKNHGIWYQSLLSISFVLGSIALVSTLSRTAIIAWIVVVAVRLSLLCKWHGLKRENQVARNLFIPALSRRMIHNSLFLIQLLIAGIVFFFIASLFFQSILPRFLQTNLTDESVTQRLQLLQESLHMLQTHLLFGVGLGNFLPMLAKQNKLISLTFGLQPVHNIFLYVASETGLIGFFFFCLFLFQTIWHA